MTKPRHPFGIALLVASLLLHLVCVVLFLRQPDRFAAITVIPFWCWAILGLGLSAFAYFFFRTPLSLFMSAVWFASVLMISDEAVVLGRFDQSPIAPGPAQTHAGRLPYRVATINWSGRNTPLTPALRPWHPDIVFIQEMPHPYLVKQLADELYGQTGDYRFDETYSCGVVVRGKITKALLAPEHRSQFLTIRTARGDYMELVNLHLQPAPTDLSLWSPSCWREHCGKRKSRRQELLAARFNLEAYTPYPYRPAIIAGDFNAPATDPTVKALGEEFTDTFRAVGTGWGNTYHRRVPFLRLDQIHSSRHFLPVRSRVVRVEESDHRLLLSDLLLE